MYLKNNWDFREILHLDCFHCLLLYSFSGMVLSETDNASEQISISYLFRSTYFSFLHYWLHNTTTLLGVVCAGILLVLRS